MALAGGHLCMDGGALENGVVELLFTYGSLCEHFFISSGVHV
jgi:hypothetical protein